MCPLTPTEWRECEPIASPFSLRPPLNIMNALLMKYEWFVCTTRLITWFHPPWLIHRRRANDAIYYDLIIFMSCFIAVIRVSFALMGISHSVWGKHIQQCDDCVIIKWIQQQQLSRIIQIDLNTLFNVSKAFWPSTIRRNPPNISLFFFWLMLLENFVFICLRIKWIMMLRWKWKYKRMSEWNLLRSIRNPSLWLISDQSNTRLCQLMSL